MIPMKNHYKNYRKFFYPHRVRTKVLPYRSTPPAIEPSVARRLLTEIMRESGSPLLDIAKRSHIPLSTLYDMLAGRTRNPRNHTFRRLFVLYCEVITQRALTPSKEEE